MNYSRLHSSSSMSHLIEHYGFGSIDSGTIGDVDGQVSIAIAKKYP
jgi:hypothetical protein